VSASDPYERVRAFLADADVRPEFAARAFARIEAQDAELGTSFLWTSLGGLVRECVAEAEDLAAWAALIACRIEQDAADPFADRRARAALSAAVVRGDEAGILLDELRRMIERAA
jgi:hypothetical protein